MSVDQRGCYFLNPLDIFISHDRIPCCMIKFLLDSALFVIPPDFTSVSADM